MTANYYDIEPETWREAMQAPAAPIEIKQARLDAGLTQSKAAATVGVALRTWQHWELGDRKISETAWRLFCILTQPQA